jgi:hypothetical protein
MKHAIHQWRSAIAGISRAGLGGGPACWDLEDGREEQGSGLDKENTVTITEVGSDLEFKSRRTLATGRSVASRYTMPAAGGQGKMLEATMIDGVSAKRTSQYTVSPDGKTMTVIAKWTDPNGQPGGGTFVYDKQ